MILEQSLEHKVNKFLRYALGIASALTISCTSNDQKFITQRIPTNFIPMQSCCQKKNCTEKGYKYCNGDDNYYSSNQYCWCSDEPYVSKPAYSDRHYQREDRCRHEINKRRCMEEQHGCGGDGGGRYRGRDWRH